MNIAVRQKSPICVLCWLLYAGMLIGSGCNRSISTSRRLHVFSETPVAVMATPTNESCLSTLRCADVKSSA